MTWHGESRRHSLASKGIKSKSESKGIGQNINYEHDDEIIMAFWRANLDRDYSNFDWDKAFKALKDGLEYNLWDMGILDLDAQIEKFDRFAGYTGTPGRIEYLEDWYPDRFEELEEMGLDDEEIVKTMAEELLDIAQDYPPWTEWLNAYDDLKDPPKDQLGRVLLMDKLIWLAHERGSVWSDSKRDYDPIDVEELRERFEREYERERLA